MPNKTYRLYPKAIEDLESIYLYSTQEFGIKRTEDYILAIATSFQYRAIGLTRDISHLINQH